jgi:hypothetical protein
VVSAYLQDEQTLKSFSTKQLMRQEEWVRSKETPPKGAKLNKLAQNIKYLNLMLRINSS